MAEGKEDPYLYKVLSKISQLLLTITNLQNESPCETLLSPLSSLSLAPQT